MAFSCTIPYFAPPTFEDIKASQNMVGESSGRRIVQVGFFTAKTMLFVKECANIPVPTVYCLFSKKEEHDHQVNYIIMETVQGQTLLSLWSTLTTGHKTAISRQLRGSFDELRKIPSPGCYGSLAFALKYQYNCAPEIHQKAEYYRRVLPVVLRGDPTSFSHADFQRKNLILRPDGTVVMVDWEAAGWYPPYWESAMAMFACGRWEDDWHAWVAQILDEHPNECAWMVMIRNELWS
ncbi:phosphotransferase enzyme family protein [Diplogelasinospora grovesii]|uniref:Phosphotransferase enzyme family protein n=1 Tax=Diplogelasinospora grovesii TaxID=303347 RepID=A0AAN6MZK0_9PEZI|nr:phosphotransferase enzyme family protein [Diplogelasinospora grovesii]